MEKVYSCENPLLAQHIKNLLASSKIECFLKNSAIQSLVGEVPPIAAWPEVWVVNPADKTKAEEIIRTIDSENANASEEWRCGRCDEANDSNFNICWNCSQSKN